MDTGKVIGRRQFLKGAAAVGATGAMATLPATRAGASTALTLVPVFRLSTRGQNACNACKTHARFRYYRLRRFANGNRAHLGCNCNIVRQFISKTRWNRLFLRRNGTLRQRWDVRWSK